MKLFKSCEETLFKIISIISNVPGIVDEEIMECWSTIVRTTSHGKRLLLLAFSMQNQQDLLVTIRFLLQVGADPDTVDETGNGPLHILVMSFNGEQADSIARLLLYSGAHSDGVNNRGMTIADLWFHVTYGRRMELQQSKEEISGLPEWCQRRVPTLTCLSAKIIRHNRVPYSRLPMRLQAFVELR